MPITSSAKKKMRRDIRKRALNLRKKIALKKAIKAVRRNPTIDAFKVAQKALDKMVKVNLIHRNQAARLKSQLAKQVKQTKSQTNK